MLDKKTKRNLVILVILVLAIILVVQSNVFEAKEITIARDNPFLGYTILTIKQKTIFSSVLATFQKTSVAKGENVDIRDSITRIGGDCSVESWQVFVARDGGTRVGLGDVAEYANQINVCNLEIWVQFATTTSGTYSLDSEYKWSGGSLLTSEGTNTLTVREEYPTTDCEYQDWLLFSSMEWGVIKWRQYKDMDLTDDNLCNDHSNEYSTNCYDGFHIVGDYPNQVGEGVKQCEKDPICGNSICEEGENYNNCPSDCKKGQTGGEDVNSFDYTLLIFVLGGGLIIFGIIKGGKKKHGK